MQGFLRFPLIDSRYYCTAQSRSNVILSCFLFLWVVEIVALSFTGVCKISSILLYTIQKQNTSTVIVLQATLRWAFARYLCEKCWMGSLGAFKRIPLPRWVCLLFFLGRVLDVIICFSATPASTSLFSYIIWKYNGLTADCSSVHIFPAFEFTWITQSLLLRLYKL